MTQSIVENVTERQVAGRRWVVGRQLHSEILNYRTWYFATVADDLAVLVTFAAHREYANTYLKDVKTVIATLSLNKPVRRE